MNCNAYLQDPAFAAELGVMAVYHLDRTDFPSFDPPCRSRVQKVSPAGINCRRSTSARQGDS